MPLLGLLVPFIGSLMPRPMSPYDLERLRADLERRLAGMRQGRRRDAIGGRAGQLERILKQIEAISPRPAPRSPPEGET